MSCGCEQPDPNPCDPAITSPESVSSQLTNLTSQLFGSVTKTIVNGRFVWSQPCAASLPFDIYGVTPDVGEGMLCYIIRALKAIPGVATLDVLVFANDAERAATAPKYIGQPGIQEDTKNIYIAGGTTAGDWNPFNLALANIPAALFTADVSGRAKFANGFITAALIAAGTITVTEIANGTFTADVTGRGKFANGFVNAALLATDSVETLKIVDLAVTAAKLATILDLSGKTLTMPPNHWRDIAPAGSVLQVKYAEYTTSAALTDFIPIDDSIPLIGEGNQVLSQTITPSSSSNKILASFNAFCSAGTDRVTACIFRGSTNIQTTVSTLIGSNQTCPIPCDVMDSPATTSELTYTVRVGATASSTYLNGVPAGRNYGGSARATFTLMEIKG